MNLAVGALSLLMLALGGGSREFALLFLDSGCAEFSSGCRVLFVLGNIWGGRLERGDQWSPHQAALRIGMTVFGSALYLLAVRALAITVRRLRRTDRTYNVTGRLPYYAACAFSCAAGALDPLGIKLFFMSTVPAALGVRSGLMWADLLMPRAEAEKKLLVGRAPGWWIAAVVLGICYIGFLGPRNRT